MNSNQNSPQDSFNLWLRLKAAIRSWIDRILQGTHHHYFCWLPRQSGTLFSWILKTFFSGIRVSPEQLSVIQTIPDNAVVVYATQYKSDFEYLFYHTRYHQEGLPVPEIGFDYAIRLFQPSSRIFRILLSYLDYFLQHWRFPNPYQNGYIRDELLNGKAGLLSLVEKKGFYLRFVEEKPDPMRYLIEFQQSTDRPVYIVPQLMFFSRKPQKATLSIVDILFGPEENPGMIRRIITLFRNPGKVFAEVSDPVNLRQFLESDPCRMMSEEQKASELRQFLLMQMNRHRQSITGPVLKPVEELKESILTRERLRSFMEHHAEGRKIPLAKIYKEADEYIDEIAAKYSPGMISFLAKLVEWITTAMFEGVTVNTDVLNRIKAMNRKGPLILVPCHKSHIDYLILSYLLYQNDMPCPHIVAGKNLAFWPMGAVFRSGGAFFIRRAFRGAVLYSKVLSEYVCKLLEEGFNIEFFIEGGRSRTGKLLQPKLGMLSILINACKSGAANDLMFVPVFIGYDRVPEESSYLHELEGGQKKAESLSQMIKAGKVLKKRYGRIYVKFHEPISLNDYALQRTGKSIHDMNTKEQNTLCRSLGYAIIRAIDDMTVITPHAVAASALLNCSRQRFSLDHFMSHVETYMNYLYQQNAKLADTLIMDYTRAATYAFESYVQRKFVEIIKDGESSPEVFYTVNTSRRPALEYYKNNCITIFIPPAFTALCILEKDAFQFSASDLHDGYKFLENLFRNEFASDADKTPEYHVRKNIKAFIDDAILMPHPTLPDTYNLTSIGFRKLKLFAGFLKTYFESYRIVLNFFARYPQNYVDPKNRIHKIQSIGNRMYKQKEIDRKEALSGIYYKNAADFFNEHNIKGSEDTEQIEYFSKAIEKYLGYLQDN